MKPLLPYPRWHAEYKRIADILGIDEKKDCEATALLSRLLEGREDFLEEAEKRISGKHVSVYGAGPSLEKSPVGALCIASDGATSYLLKKGKIPEIIVTDLDGRIGDIRKASSSGSILFVHAHGDNMDEIKKYVPQLRKVVGTTQVEPKKDVYNFGGFTDGDRALFIAKALGAASTYCFGFDFGDIVGKYSKPSLSQNRKAHSMKKKKLEIAQYLVEKYRLCDRNL